MITLPAGVLWVTEELGVFVVEGDRMTIYEGVGKEHRAYIQPDEWAQYDKPCETCEAYPGHSPNFWLEPCPNTDCRDGRQVWTVRAVCPECKGRAGTPTTPGRVHFCFNCDEGYVEARATIQVIPVVKQSPPHEVRQFVTRWGAGWLLVNRDSPLGEQVTMLCEILNSLPVPGRDWAVIVRKVSDA